VSSQTHCQLDDHARHWRARSFDAFFVKIVPPVARTEEMKRCLALVTIMCFLGEIRCHYSEEAHGEYYTAMLQAMNDNGLTLFEVDEADPTKHDTKNPSVNSWCMWISMFSEERKIYDHGRKPKTIKAEDLQGYERDLAEAVQQHVINYFINQPSPASPHPTLCFGKDELKPLDYNKNNPVPLVLQLMRFAFLHPEDVRGNPYHDNTA
jgi:hypothetical protein